MTVIAVHSPITAKCRKLKVTWTIETADQVDEPFRRALERMKIDAHTA